MIRFKKLYFDALIPKRHSVEAAGFDLHAFTDEQLWPGESVTLRTGIAAALPEGTVGMIRSRSGLAVRHGIDVLAGTIDSDYRGEIRVVLINHGGVQVDILKGDRIAQLVVVPVFLDAISVEELDDTERGEDGFGSTG